MKIVFPEEEADRRHGMKTGIAAVAVMAGMTGIASANALTNDQVDNLVPRTEQIGT